MKENIQAGALLRAALTRETPLQMVGVINAYAAIMAEQVGFQALYLSGAGVANASYGLPDLALTTLPDVLEDVRRVTSVTALPLLVDIDTGWGGAFMIARAIREMSKAGAAGVHIEDQVQSKRCGHRPNKAIVSTEEMVDRLKAAVDARTDQDFVIMARTDALAREGLDAALQRAWRYKEAGADMLFPEAVATLEQYRAFTQIGLPVLANLTEFGLTPLFSCQELAQAGVSMVLYPLSAFRAMSAAALNVYRTIRQQGSQKAAIPAMQTREELYEFLGYHAYEQKLDALFAQQEQNKDD
ncbi:methylisocitrate lyase [Ktedonosporobacter rubrisoli]|uniref:2-methylisocitrate lyase n=1 Tax=Ktedonosporobacter rubrisoli TaxID=2509675 RepID=A0A4P6K6G2_KTERU|nr:methylisocitrate lyase [Ktedonosporobacter rubrisoli]